MVWVVGAADTIHHLPNPLGREGGKITKLCTSETGTIRWNFLWHQIPAFHIQWLSKLLFGCTLNWMEAEATTH